MIYDKNNIFAKIIRGELPSKKVYEDDKVLAFHDIYPKAPIHIIVIPKGEYISFDDFAVKASDEEIAHFFRIAQKIAAEHGLQPSGYRIGANHGKDANQIVFHFHLHILGGGDLRNINLSK
ncbi:MAG: histidine triad nucleotide-binding protein [Sphingobacteriia bacterium]|nr:histidine triad nucleotide-binding protein [Sphingobacteriia bacterium]